MDRTDAENLGLIAYKNGEAYVGVDYKTTLLGANHPGRPSVRLESQAQYNKGLIIGRFTHLPKNVCGSWPAL